MTTTEPSAVKLPLDPAKLWAALTAATGKGTPGWRLVRCRNTPGRSLFAALEPGGKRRVLLLPLSGARAPGRRHWPRIAGLEPVNVAVSGEPHVGVALKDVCFADVFDALTVDLSRRVEAALTSNEALSALLGQLARWQKFLTAATDGLSTESQRGLWGELHCLSAELVPRLGPTEAVDGWKGPARAHQDFQFRRGAIEVKTTTAKQPQSVRITSERQLDDQAWPALFLHVLFLEEHEGAALTLPRLVETVRAKLAADLAAREKFEDALLSAGYLDAHASRYATLGYAVRAAHWFCVAGDFPRIVENQLPAGLGEVGYALSLAACTAFRTTARRALRSLSA